MITLSTIDSFSLVLRVVVYDPISTIAYENDKKNLAIEQKKRLERNWLKKLQSIQKCTEFVLPL